MKKFLLVLCICLLVCGCGKKAISQKKNREIDEQIEEKSSEEIKKNIFVSYNGALQVKGINLVNQYDEVIQLKGVSSHGLQWYGDFVNDQNLKTLKNDFNSNVFRLAMYTKEGGYIDNKEIMQDVIKDIDLVIANDMYVIVDWHILSDGNPNAYVEEAINFFEEISSKYKNSPNIIYEICNEPNGTSWSEIKSYSERVIEVIRKNCNNIIIVGTNTWSQDVLDPVNDRLNYDNIMYALHFYAGTHTDYLRKRAKEALDKGISLFVSEWGVSDASGNGGVFLDEAQKWIDFMNENKLSFVSWSLSNKDESSALLKPGSNVNFNNSDLSEAGQFVKKAIIGNI